MPDDLDVAGALRDQRIFITGATGLVGKVLVEKLLFSVPEVGRLLLLVRPGKGLSAAERFEREVLGSPVMWRLSARHGPGFRQWVGERVEVVAGDLGRDRFGLEPAAYEALSSRVDRVVASAATVTFDERLDRALELNVRGALRSLALARDAGGVPLVHVSTCYVSGRRQGWIDEEVAAVPAVLAPGEEGGPADPEAVLGQLDERCRQLAAASATGGTGSGNGESGSDGDAPWVAAGAEQAARHGFHDVYTLTKALAERLLTDRRGTVPLAIVRPAIVESALAEPLPGWLEAVRVVDPLLAAYGRGRASELPGSPEVPLELVPVDHVVNAMLAALASLGPAAADGDLETGEVAVYQVGSSRNPITLGELLEHAREGFAASPLTDEGGAPVTPGPPRLVEPEELRRRLQEQRRKVEPLSVVGRTLDHFIRLIDVYRPYLSTGDGQARYRDETTRKLWERLSPAARAELPFDVAAIDWRRYVTEVHIPGLVRFALKAESGAPQPIDGELAGQGADWRQRSQQRLEQAARRATEAANLFELFESVATAHPEAIAFQTYRDGRWLRYSYGQALAATANVAWRLATEHGIGRGDRVVLLSAGRPEWVIVAFAAWRLGAVAVPLDPQWPAAEAAEAARQVGAGLICAAPPLPAALAALPPGSLGCPVVALEAPFVPQPGVGVLPEAAAFFDRLEPGATAGSDDLAAILFTSGTSLAATGVLPKAVPLTHGNYLANVRDLVPIMRLERERLLSVLPIHHTFEQMVGLFVPMAGASAISYVAEIRPQEISWMMATTRPTVLVAVPRLLELLHGGIFKSVEAGGPMLQGLFKVLFALSRLTGGRIGHRLFGKVHRRFGGALRRIATGGSALDAVLGRSFQLMGFVVAEGYGMTETSPVLTVNPWDEIRFGAVGRPLPGVDIELRPPADATGVAPGSGEIWVRGGNVMAGYYENPEATAQVMDGGWLNTGDIGQFDRDGYLAISGRSKDVIVTAAGKNVYPEEVEGRYRGNGEIEELVEELVVLGLPSDSGGEQVAAVAVPRQGATDAEIEQIRAAIAAHGAEVPSYQQIGRVEIWRGELPKTTTMKVKRGLLREAVVSGEGGAGERGVGEQGGDGAKRSAPAPPPADGAAQSEGERWVVDTLARLTRSRPDRLRPEARLAELGVDSLTRVELVGEIEARTGKRLPDTEAQALSRVRDLFELV